jgi:hypothetical protein
MLVVPLCVAFFGIAILVIRLWVAQLQALVLSRRAASCPRAVSLTGR